MNHRRRSICLAASLLPVTLAAFAQDPYPTRPITLVVPSQAGGPVDSGARAFASRMGELLGQPIVIDNRVSAGGVVGTAAVARARPDGYTLLYSGAGPISIAPQLVAKLDYDPDKLIPIALTARAPALIVTGPNTGITSIQDLIAKAKSKPGFYSYSTAGLGGPSHLAFESLKMLSGIDLLQVPYKGVPQAATAVMADEVSVGIVTFDSMPLVQAGKMRALAVTSKAREPSMPDVPSMSEVGVPDLLYLAWFGLFAPPGTPQAILDKITAAALKANAEDATQQVLLKRFGVRTAAAGPAEFQAQIRSDRTGLERLIKAQNIKVE
jgi:tripartite-type tricarboxylate transporter receptor subunit TctC